MQDLFDDQISAGKVADEPAAVARLFPETLTQKFEIFSYRNAATILKGGFPEQFHEITQALDRFEITKTMIRTPGGSKGPIASYVDTLFSDEWQETRISADLNVRLIHAKQPSKTLSQYTRHGFLDGHRIDFVKGKVALDLEWNSKDQTYDRDLSAFAAFYDAGAIDVGFILTRVTARVYPFLTTLGKVLNKDGTDGADDVYKKFGASTTC